MTDLDRDESEIFQRLHDPDCRCVRLRPVDSAYLSWRGALTLPPKYRARSRAWPVLTTMRPGLALGPEVGLDRWEAERAFEGLLNREPRYVEYATAVLQDNAGFVLELPGGVAGVVIAERDFAGAVELGEPVHLTVAPVPA